MPTDSNVGQGKRRGKSRVIEVIIVSVKKPGPDFKCK
nr:MAG TPA: hypothetical protein [Caudoviricetes sp.]